MKLYVCYGTWRKAVPVIVDDDGTVVQGSERIAECAQVHPAHTGDPVASEAT